MTTLLRTVGIPSTIKKLRVTRGLGLLLMLVLPASAVAQGLSLVSTALSDTLEAPSANLFVYDDLVFVGGLSQGYTSFDNIGVRILDVSDRDNPVLMGRIPLRSSGFWRAYTVGSAVVTEINSETFRGPVAVVLNGVPDSYSSEDWPEPYGVWDVSDPADPQFLGVFGEGQAPHADLGDLGDYPKLVTAVAGHLFFYVYQSEPRERSEREKLSHRLGIVDLSDPYNPVQVASWQETAESALLAVASNEAGTRVYIGGVWPKPFGRQATHVQLHILDTSDPSAPTKIGGWEMPQRAAGEEEVSSTFALKPTRRDSLVVFADGAWGTASLGNHSILHFLDTSDPSNVDKISEFDPFDPAGPDSSLWTMASNVAIRGDVVYSTWMDYGVVAIDISDVRNPEETGVFRDHWAMSDAVPLGDAHVVAAKVWKEGLWVLLDEGVAGRGTAVGEGADLPTRTVLHQNYPNPFSMSTEVSFELSERSNVRLSVFDLLGRQVAEPVRGRRNAGRHTVRLDLEGLPVGVYLYRLDAGSKSLTRRAVLLR